VECCSDPNFLLLLLIREITPLPSEIVHRNCPPKLNTKKQDLSIQMQTQMQKKIGYLAILRNHKNVEPAPFEKKKTPEKAPVGLLGPPISLAVIFGGFSLPSDVHLLNVFV
jgi:hypothetical protein